MSASDKPSATARLLPMIWPFGRCEKSSTLSTSQINSAPLAGSQSAAVASPGSSYSIAPAVNIVYLIGFPSLLPRHSLSPPYLQVAVASCRL